MSPSDLALVFALVAFLLAAIFLAASEASLLRVSEFRAKALAETGERRAVRLERLLARLPSVLNMILLLALLSQIGAATVTGIVAQNLFGNLGVTIASIVLTIVLFIYGEAIPKTYAIRHSERTALFVALPIGMLERVLRPIVSALVWLADIQAPGKGVGTAPTVTEKELRLLADRAALEGEITEHDLELIERAFRFGDRRVDDIMVPRPDITAIGAGVDIEEAIDIAIRSGHRRLPVVGDSLEDIRGVVGLRDLIEYRDRGGVGILEIAGDPLLVPESQRVTSLLEDMRERQIHLAIVIDEHGATAGLVTIEDVAEELLGEFGGESGPPEWEELGRGEWRVAGSIPVEDLEQIGISVPDGGWNTVAGLMVGVAGRLLSRDDSVEVDGHRLTVSAVDGRRIVQVTIERIAGGSD